MRVTYGNELWSTTENALSLPGSVGAGEFETIALKDVEEAFGELHRR